MAQFSWTGGSLGAVDAVEMSDCGFVPGVGDCSPPSGVGPESAAEAGAKAHQSSATAVTATDKARRDLLQAGVAARSTCSKIVLRALRSSSAECCSGATLAEQPAPVQVVRCGKNELGACEVSGHPSPALESL